MLSFSFACTNLRVSPATLLPHLFKEVRLDNVLFPSWTHITVENRLGKDFVRSSHASVESFVEHLQKLEDTLEINVIALSADREELLLAITKNYESYDSDIFGFIPVETPENLRVKVESAQGYTKKVSGLPPSALGYLKKESNSLSQFFLHLENEHKSSLEEVSGSFCREKAYQIAAALQPDFIFIEPFGGRSLNVYVEENGIERLYTGSSFFFYWRGELKCSLGESQWINGRYLEHFKKHSSLWNECLEEIRSIEGVTVEEMENGLYIDAGISKVQIDNPDSFSQVNRRAKEVGEILEQYHTRAYALSEKFQKS